MSKVIFILQLSFCTICINQMAIVAASEYVPWKEGDHALYADSFGNSIEIEIDRESRNWSHYTNFAGLGPLWIQTHPNNEQVFIRPTERAKKQLMVDFNEPEGTVTTINIAPCNNGAVRIVSKGEQISVPAGTFNGVIRLDLETSCADGGVTAVWFAPDVGFIRWESSNISGPISTEMIHGTVNGIIYPQGLTISAIFPDPVFAIDMEPPVNSNRAADTVSVHLNITNNTGRDLTYLFTSGQLFEIKLLDANGKVVSSWSRGKAFTAILQRLALKDGETWNLGGEIELSADNGEALPPGNYTLIIEMTSSPEPGTDHQPGSEKIAATAPLTILHAL